MKDVRSYARVCLATMVSVGAGLAFGVAPAAANLACGAVITASTTLTHDLVDGPGLSPRAPS